MIVGNLAGFIPPFAAAMVAGFVYLVARRKAARFDTLVIARKAFYDQALNASLKTASTNEIEPEVPAAASEAEKSPTDRPTTPQPSFSFWDVEHTSNEPPFGYITGAHYHTVKRSAQRLGRIRGSLVYGPGGEMIFEPATKMFDPEIKLFPDYSPGEDFAWPPVEDSPAVRRGRFGYIISPRNPGKPK